jgi:septal ring factor EnvC (AmiA/AmiB activator)
VAKQEETQAEMTQVLESIDASSRAEHEATRRELEQMKQALAQIEQDMIRRDDELKELLTAIGRAHGDKEKKNLQERSNAVTVALCALVTVYQSLQVRTICL